jgi:hypothetical protein
MQEKARPCQAVTKLAESGRFWRVDAAGAKARPYFSMLCGPTKSRALLQSMVPIAFRNSLL